MGRLKLLIVAGAKEGETLAEAAAAAGISALLREPGETLFEGEAPPPAGAVLFATGLESESLLPSFVGLRQRLGDRVLTFVLGDTEGSVAEGLDPDVIFTRPMDPDLLMSQISDCLSPIDVAATLPTVDPALTEPLPSVPIVLSEPERYPPADALELVAEGLDLELEAGLSAAASEVQAEEADGSPSSAAAPRPAGRWDSGELGPFGLLSALGRAFCEGFSGRLRLRRGEVDKAIYFEAGRPVLATSSDPQDRLIEVLLRKGRVSPEEHRRATNLCTQSGRRMGAVLVELGVLKRAELLPVLRLHYEEIISSLFRWEEGTFEWDRDVLADPRRIRLLEHPAWLLVEGLRTRSEVELAERVGAPGRVLAVSERPAAWEIVRALDRNPAWARIIRLFDGVRSIEDVARAADNPASARAVALTLLELGAADDVEGTGLLARLEVDRDRLLAWIALGREGDYFQVLGVGRGASTEQIQKARRRMSAALAEGHLDPTLRQAFAEELADLMEVLAEAGRVLEDEGLRQRYLRALSWEHGGTEPNRARSVGVGGAKEAAV